MQSMLEWLQPKIGTPDCGANCYAKLNGSVGRPCLPPIEFDEWADQFNTLLNGKRNDGRGLEPGKYYEAEKEITGEMRNRLNGGIKGKEVEIVVN